MTTNKASWSPPKLGEACQDGEECIGARLRLPHRSKMDFTSFEEVTLDCLRFICWSYSRRDFGTWDEALKFAGANFGPHHGPIIAVRLCGLMHALRVEKRKGFSFLSAFCHHICDDELAIMSLIKAARQGHGDTVQEIGRYVTGHSIAHQTVTAAKRLSNAQLEALSMPERSKHGSPKSAVAKVRGDLH